MGRTRYLRTRKQYKRDLLREPKRFQTKIESAVAGLPQLIGGGGTREQPPALADCISAGESGGKLVPGVGRLLFHGESLICGRGDRAALVSVPF